MGTSRSDSPDLVTQATCEKLKVNKKNMKEKTRDKGQRKLEFPT